MRFSSSFLALPTTLLLLIASGNQAQAVQDDQTPAESPNNVPREPKVWPEDPHNHRRDVEAKKHLLREGYAPVGVKKMSSDPDEKFYPEYWRFGEEEMQQAVLGVENSLALRQDYHHEEQKELYINGTAPLSFRPPFLFHTEKEPSLNRRSILEGTSDWMEGKRGASALALLVKRDFKCVLGTNPCMNINQPNLCCAVGETCYPISDNGLGTVGCCPSDQVCSGPINCASPNTPCLVNNTGGFTGGGCCIPGFVCAGIGCVPQVSVISSTQTTIISQSSTAVVIVVTETVTPSVTTSTSTTTKTAAQTTQTSAETATVTSISISTKTTGTGVGPERATTVPSASFSSSISSSTPSTSTCPIGYYACSATYRGGCCQTGRDCQTTNCPSQASITIVSSGQTIVVPLTPSATTTASGHCATGWSSCLPAQGGACCPNDWTCGSVSCFSSIAGATQSASQPKEGVVLSGATRLKDGRIMMVVASVCLVFARMIVT